MPDENLYVESRQAYDDLAPSYGIDHTGERIDREVVRFFLKHLDPPARILDIGSGPGQYARWFAREGYEVMAIDNSAQMILEAKRRGLPAGMNAVCMDMRNLNFRTDSFDAVFALASLIHLTQDALPAVLTRLHSILNHEGLFLANFAISDKGLRRERESATQYANAGRFFQHYNSQDEPRAMMEAAGFEVQEIYVHVVRPVLKDGSKGKTEWVNFLARAK